MAEQPSLFVPTQHGEQPAAPYPWTPAPGKTETSAAAAEAIAPEVERLRDRCLLAIQDTRGGLTADEVAAALHESVLAIRPRICELAKLGKIVDNTLRRRNASGRLATVWRAT